MTTVQDGPLAAGFRFHDGAAVAAGLDGLRASDAPGWRWAHLRADDPETEAWLLSDPDLPEVVAWALIAEDTRPRYAQIDGGALIVLRGVNLNPGAEPEDMVSIRMFVTEARVVSVQRRRLRAVDDIIAAARAGRGPEAPGAFVALLIETLREKVEPVLDELQEIVDQLEIDAADDPGGRAKERRASLNAAHHDAIQLRRHLAPQAEALRALTLQPLAFLEGWADAIREEADAFRRIADDLDTARARAQVVREEFALRLAERQNAAIMLLSVLSGVFLPLTFVTGLLGMNVGGLPLGGPAGFWIVVGGLGCLAAGLLWIARRLDLL